MPDLTEEHKKVLACLNKLHKKWRTKNSNDFDVWKVVQLDQPNTKGKLFELYCNACDGTFNYSTDSGRVNLKQFLKHFDKIVKLKKSKKSKILQNVAHKVLVQNLRHKVLYQIKTYNMQSTPITDTAPAQSTKFPQDWVDKIKLINTYADISELDWKPEETWVSLKPRFHIFCKCCQKFIEIGGSGRNSKGLDSQNWDRHFTTLKHTKKYKALLSTISDDRIFSNVGDKTCLGFYESSITINDERYDASCMGKEFGKHFTDGQDWEHVGYKKFEYWDNGKHMLSKGSYHSRRCAIEVGPDNKFRTCTECSQIPLQPDFIQQLMLFESYKNGTTKLMGKLQVYSRTCSGIVDIPLIAVPISPALRPTEHKQEYNMSSRASYHKFTNNKNLTPIQKIFKLNEQASQIKSNKQAIDRLKKRMEAREKKALKNILDGEIENFLGLAHLTERSDRLQEFDEGQIDNFEGLVGNVAAPYRSNDGIGEHVYRIGDTVEARYKLNRGEYMSGLFQAQIMNINADNRTYSLQYDDGDAAEGVKHRDLQPPYVVAVAGNRIVNQNSEFDPKPRLDLKRKPTSAAIRYSKRHRRAS